MFGSAVIDVGIGMALLFLFMSLIATALRETIENFLKSRSKDLERGIKELLQERSNPGKTKEFYEHPLIASLYDGDYASGKTKLPSYIPRQSFAAALLDIVAQAANAGSPLSLVSLRASLAAEEAPNAVQRVVLNAIDTAEGDADKLKRTLEEWYDSTMDRVSGWYTRRTGRILGALGFAAAVFFNVDAITVAQSLIRDKALRDAVVAQAESYARAADAGKNGGENKGIDQLTDLNDQLAQIGYPIGWKWHDDELYPAPQACQIKKASAPAADPIPECRLGWLQAVTMIGGWVITALAVMLGAPFWFDVMNKFMVVRSTVKPKEKSPDEAPVDHPPETTPSADASKAGTLPHRLAVDFEVSAQIAAASTAATLALNETAFVPHAWANDPDDPDRGVI